MQGLIIPTLLVAACLAITGVRTEKYDRDFRGADVFQVIDIPAFKLRSRVLKYGTPARGNYAPPFHGPSEMDKLEDFLEKNTDSEDPLENLDIVVESLNSDYKNNGPSRTPSTSAKRLVAALSTLNGENLCNHYGFRIIKKNLSVLPTNIRQLAKRKSTGRLDKILEHFVHEHAENCRQTYINKFDELSVDLDETMMRRLNILLKGAVETLTSKTSKDKPYVERLFNAAAESIIIYFMLESPYIYEAIKDSVGSELNAGPLDQVGSYTKSGSTDARGRDFGQIFDEMVSKPCGYFRERFGPDVFEPALFDIRISNEFDSNRVDFYEALVKYRFCSLDTFSKQSVKEEFVDYVKYGR